MGDAGYEYEVIGDVFEDLFCQICLKLMKDAVQLECGHGMCNGCLQALIKNAHEENRELTCPKCRKIILTEKVMKNAMLNQVITSVRVKCQNSASSCKWEGRISEMLDHLQQVCECETVSCSHDNCEEIVVRFELRNHEKYCSYRKIGCEFCKCKFQQNQLEEHYKICELLPIYCPNQCSNTLFIRKKIKGHLEHCDNEVISCDFSQYGCNVKMKRMDNNDHLSQNPQHLLLLLREQKDLRSLLETFKEKNSNLERKVRLLTNQVQSNDDTGNLSEIKEVIKRLQSAEEDIIQLKSSNERWMKNGLHFLKQKLADSVKILLLETKIEGESLAIKHHENISQLIKDFKDSYGVLQGSLENLQETVDYKISLAIEEIKLIFEPLKLQSLLDDNFEKLISELGSDTDLQMRSVNASEKHYIVEEVLLKCDDPVKICNSITRNLEMLRKHATYVECINTINKRAIQMPVLFCNDFVVVFTKVGEVVKLLNVDIELKKKDDTLVLCCYGHFNTNSFKVVKLHSQTNPTSIIGFESSNKEWIFVGKLDHLIKNGFFVGNMSLLTFHSSEGNPKFSVDTSNENKYESDNPKDLLSIVEERFDIYHNDIITAINHYDENCSLLINGLGALDTLIANKIKEFQDDVEDSLRMCFEKELHSHSSLSVVTVESMEKDQVFRKFQAFLTKKQHRYLSERMNTLESFLDEINYNKRFRKMVVASLSVFDNIVWKNGFAAIRCKIVEDGKMWFKGGLYIDKRSDRFAVSGVQIVENKFNSAVSIFLCNHHQAITLRAVETTAGYFTFPLSEKEMKEKGYMVNGNIVVKFVPESLHNDDGNANKFNDATLESFLINVMKDNCDFHNIMRRVIEEVDRIQLKITEYVCKFDEAMDILTGKIDTLSKTVHKMIKASLLKLEKISEPIKFLDVEELYEIAIQQCTSTLPDLSDKEKICNLMNEELNEINQKTQNLNNMRSITSYQERFNALFLKKLPQENQVFWNSSKTMVVLKCRLKESEVKYKRFTLSIHNSHLYLDGVNSVEVNMVKPATVTVINHAASIVIKAQNVGSKFVFPVEIQHLKKEGYLLNETVVIVMTK